MADVKLEFAEHAVVIGGKRQKPPCEVPLFEKVTLRLSSDKSLTSSLKATLASPLLSANISEDLKGKEEEKKWSSFRKTPSYAVEVEFDTWQDGAQKVEIAPAAGYKLDASKEIALTLTKLPVKFAQQWITDGGAVVDTAQPLPVSKEYDVHLELEVPAGKITKNEFKAKIESAAFETSPVEVRFPAGHRSASVRVKTKGQRVDDTTATLTGTKGCEAASDNSRKLAVGLVVEFAQHSVVVRGRQQKPP